ncbi:MAG: hypothetical protein K8R54_13120 [Bacteroidales bacterium]|nr:hypothetical protein [Bacteroidales bacterium]
MNIKLLLLIISILSVSDTAVVHPVHISIINLEYSVSNQEFDLLIRVFKDDFEAVINKDQKINIKLNENTILKNRKFIDRYIHNNFKIYFNNKNVTNNITSYKVLINEDENTSEIFYKFKSKIPKKIKVINTLFKGFFRDQKNLFIFTCNNTQEAVKFDRSKIQSEFIVK